MAAEACSFMAAFIASALVTQDRASAAQFLDKFVDGYLTLLRDEIADFNAGQLLSETSSSSIKAKETMVRLLESSEPEGSTERCWNWRVGADTSLGVEATLANRGRSYNGYPVSAEYFGSFSLDGLAMALYCLY